MQRGFAISGENAGGLQEQDQHHDGRDVADHDAVDALAAEMLAVAFHLADHIVGRLDPADEDGRQQGDQRHHDTVADVIHNIK